MRAICGAIITAGAVIGLGLAAIGFATRYQVARDRFVGGPAASLSHEQLIERLHEVDKPMMYIMVLLTAVVVIGLGVTFLGLAYHHQRRHHEHLREEQRLAGHQRTPV